MTLIFKTHTLLMSYIQNADTINVSCIQNSDTINVLYSKPEEARLNNIQRFELRNW